MDDLPVPEKQAILLFYLCWLLPVTVKMYLGIEDGFSCRLCNEGAKALTFSNVFAFSSYMLLLLFLNFKLVLVRNIVL